MIDNFLPKELVQKCFTLIESSHKRLSLSMLPKMIVTGENMVPLALVPDGLELMGSVRAIHRMRIVCWSAGCAVIVASFFLSRWILLSLVVLLIANMKLASKERQQWMLLAAFKLALEILANNFAGWGHEYSNEQKKALSLVGDKGLTTLLDFYLPHRDELDSSLLRAFGPGGV